MRTKILSIIALTLAVATSCQGGRSIHRTLDRAEAVMDETPDVALTILDSIPRSRLSSKAKFARYALLYTMAQEKCFVDVQDDSLITPAVKYYDKHGSPDDRLKAYYYAGRIHQNAGNLAYASYDMLEAERSGAASDDYFHKGMVAVSMALISNDSYNLSEGIAYSEQAIRYFRRADRPRHENMARLHKGVILKNSGRFEEAAAVLDSVLLASEQERDSVLMVNALIFIADGKVSTESPDYEGAAAIYEKIIEEFPDEMSFLDYCNYAFAMYYSGEKTAAKELLSSLEDKPVTDEDKSEYYFICYSIYKSEGQPTKALEYLETATEIHAVEVKEAMEGSFVRAQRNFLNDRTELIETRADTQRTVMIMVIILAIVVLVIMIFFIRRQVRRRENQRISLLATVSYYEDRTKGMEENLQNLKEDFKKAYRSKFDVVAAIYEKSLLAGQRVDGEAMILKRTEELLEEFKSDMKSTGSLEKKINEDLDGIMAKLRNDFPKMKQQDRDLIMYQIVGLDTMLISTLMDIEPNAVHSRRYRIKNKIAASDSPNKQLYLEMIF